MTPAITSGAVGRVWWRSVPDFPPICSGFIFCEFFSNLGPTGCRRGRTPERPLRQPSKVWLIKPDLFISGQECSRRRRLFMI
jgi:hypothetical protein